MKKIFPGCLCLLLGSAFPIIGFTMAEDQRRMFAEWIEVPAEVTGHEIRFHHDSDGDPMYGPVLKLRYLADGMPPEGEGLLVMDMWSSEGWAMDQLAPWPVGKRVTAWADPELLEKAFVVREVSIVPYVIILFPMVFVCMGAMLILFPRVEGKAQYEPGTPWAGRTFFIVWNAVGIAAAAHYFSQPGAWNVVGVSIFSVYLGIGVLPVVGMAKRAMKPRGDVMKADSQ